MTVENKTNNISRYQSTLFLRLGRYEIITKYCYTKLHRIKTTNTCYVDGSHW